MDSVLWLAVMRMERSGNIYPTKRNTCSRFSFLFFRFKSNISAIHLNIYVAHLSASLCPKIHLILFKSKSVISLEVKEGVKIQCHKCFNKMYGHHRAKKRCTPSTHPTKTKRKSNIYSKMFHSICLFSITIIIN